MIRFFNKLLRLKPKSVVIVSGLPRSGTSMMMRMLEAGGLEIVQDAIRKPNEDNPKGYYEFERVKKLPEGDVEWLATARGRVVKVIAALLIHLPQSYTYKVLFMRRRMSEILASQRKMLLRRGEDPNQVDDVEMTRLFEQHLAQVYAWMDQQANVDYIDVSYNKMLEDPSRLIEEIQAFLGQALDTSAMAAVVEPTLYRQRR